MHGEVPEFKRCCFCLPLRRGLIGWGYFRLALDVLAIVNYILTLICIISHICEYSDVTIFIALTVYYFIDAVFALLLIVGGHKKNHKLLRKSYIYGIVWLTLFLILGAFLCYKDISWIQKRTIIDLYTFVVIAADSGVFFFVIFVQVYFVLLTRSEEIKLRKENLVVQFVNNAADAELICVRMGN